MSPLAVGIICTLIGGAFTLAGIAVGTRITTAGNLDAADIERRHAEASQERQELKSRITGCEQALNRLEATVAGMAAIVRLISPNLAQAWRREHDDH